jgi:hypothetical protein
MVQSRGSREARTDGHACRAPARETSGVSRALRARWRLPRRRDVGSEKSKRINTSAQKRRHNLIRGVDARATVIL